MGIDVMVVDHDADKRVSIKAVLKKIYEQNINNLFIEAGSNVNSSLIKENLIDEIILCRSGAVFGNDGRSIINDLNINKIKDSKKFFLKESFTIDDDIIEHWGFK